MEQGRAVEERKEDTHVVCLEMGLTCVDVIQWPIKGFGGASFVNDGRGTSSVN